MRNVRIDIEYDGSHYHGWQVQPTGPTIQGVLTEILSRMDRRSVVLHGAGRTDAGVHAEGQVANFLFQRSMSEGSLLRALNGNLPAEIRVRQVAFVSRDFHARFSAKWKTYRYKIYLGSVLSPFMHKYVYHCRFRLDLSRLRSALHLFEGEHDFAAFAVKSRGSGSTVRRMNEVSLIHRDDLLEIHLTANGFLRAMARRIAGTLQEVGRDKLDLTEVAALLEGDVPGTAGPSLPAKGLTLVRVGY